MIRVLPQAVVDRIAAGEVVQRAAAAVKELTENSLDAGASSIRVVVSAPDAFSVADNGSGIRKADLPLAAVRHATSKLSNVDDLNHIQSFGFRGEALASLSMVARLKIVSKTAQTAAAYQMSYVDGKPVASNNPTATARTVGTTVSVQDLFYNLPHRKRSCSRASEEYQAVLKVVQLYAIHYAAKGVAMQCQKQDKTKSSSSSSNKTDLNTTQAVGALQRALATTCKNRSADDSDEKLKPQQQTATKNVVAQVFGSQLVPHLHEFCCELYEKEDDEKEETSSNSSGNGGGDKSNASSFIYSCSGFVTSPSYHNSGNKTKKSNMVLFINHRLIDGCASIRRALEEVYTEYCKEKPPFLYLALTVSPETVDVNVHPTKREVALLHLERICQHLAQELRRTLDATGQSFQSQSVEVKDNPYNKKRKIAFTATTTSELPTRPAAAKKPAKSMVRTSRSTQAGSLEPFLVQRTQLSQTSSTQTSTQSSESSSQSSQQIPQTQQQLSQSQASASVVNTFTQAFSSSRTPSESVVPSPEQHEPECPLRLKNGSSTSNSALDLSQPGAFAVAAAQCTCPDSTKAKMDLASASNADTPVIRLPRQSVNTAAASKSRRLRLQKVAPTVCKYTSIKQLRKRVVKQRAEDLEKKLRSACFVGTVSHDRSLIQCGEELVMMNHFECARELFYQLALHQFGGGCGIAKLPGDASSTDTISPEQKDRRAPTGIDIRSVIGQFVQMEESLRQLSEKEMAELTPPLKISETNLTLAEQASACLLEHAEMLLEYFSISIEKDNEGRIRLTGLPVLLEGYEPSPHGLPVFLLRLATEVNWTEEKPCFYGICRELGSFYAQMPSAASSEEHAALVRHTVFPAVSSLLLPLENAKGRDFITLTNLTKLYRVFERC